ncbi:CREB-binding protein-like [Discoglossus pictus]
MGITDDQQATPIFEAAVPSGNADPLVRDGRRSSMNGNMASMRVHKGWHDQVTRGHRKMQVRRIVNCIMPSNDPAVRKDPRMLGLVAYAKAVEGDMYSSANSRDEYYQLVARKIHILHVSLEEKRRERLQQRQTPVQTPRVQAPTILQAATASGQVHAVQPTSSCSYSIAHLPPHQLAVCCHSYAIPGSSSCPVSTRSYFQCHCGYVHLPLTTLRR